MLRSRPAGSGRSVYWEDPAAFNEIVGAFLERRAG